MTTRLLLATALLPLAALLTACSSDDSPDDPAAAGGTSGAAGAAGTNNTAGVSGSSGQAGSAGSTAGAAGASAGAGGAAGQAGGGAAGQAGAAGSSGAGEAGQGGEAAGGGAAGQGGGGAAGEGGQAGTAAGGAGQSGGGGEGGSDPGTCDEELGKPCETGLLGVCAMGKQDCQAGKIVCLPVIAPGAQGEMCNGLDDDCNGKVDDLDVGGDGFCDCLRIGILGLPGSNPSSNFQAWLEERGTSVERVLTTADEALTASVLAKFDVVIIDRLLREYSAAEAASLQAWVKAGGGFVSMTGYNNSPTDFYANTLLAPFGLSYGGDLSIADATVFTPHPVTEGLTQVTFKGGYVVTPTTVPGGTSLAIASNVDGTIAYAHEQGEGRAVVWGDEWIEFDSEWETLPQIKQLWVNLVSWTGPQGFCQVPKP